MPPLDTSPRPSTRHVERAPAKRDREPIDGDACVVLDVVARVLVDASIDPRGVETRDGGREPERVHLERGDARERTGVRGEVRARESTRIVLRSFARAVTRTRR